MVRPGDSIAKSVAEHWDDWRDLKRYKKRVELHNQCADLKIEADPTTRSEKKLQLPNCTLQVPSCLLWTPQWKQPRPVPPPATDSTTAVVSQMLTVDTTQPTVSPAMAPLKPLGPGPDLVSLLTMPPPPPQQPTQDNTPTSLETYKVIQYFINKVLGTPVASNRPSHVSEQDWEATLQMILPSDVNEVLGGMGPMSPQVTKDDIAKLPRPHLEQLVLAQQRKRNDDNLMSAALALDDQMSQNKQGTSTEKRAESPYIEDMRKLPPIVHKLEEMNVSLKEWSSLVQHEMVKTSFADVSDNKLMNALNRANEEIPDLKWETVSGKNQTGESSSVAQPDAEPVIAALQWAHFKRLQNMNPFDLDLGWPNKLGCKQGLAPYFSFESVKYRADVSGHLPQPRDYLLTTHKEAEHQRLYTSAIATLNNIIMATTRLTEYILIDTESLDKHRT